MLDDGRYDAVILDARTRADATEVSLAIATGPNRGDVVELLTAPRPDALGLLGLPCTLVVEDGVPRLEA